MGRQLTPLRFSVSVPGVCVPSDRGKRDFPVFVFDPARLQRLDTTSGVVVDTQMRRALLYCLLVMDEVVGRSNYDFVYCHHAGSWFSRKYVPCVGCAGVVLAGGRRMLVRALTPLALSRADGLGTSVVSTTH